MNISRRSFVAASLSAPFAFPSLLNIRTGRPWKNEKLRVVQVGCGGMGSNDLAAVANHKSVEIVGLCDIDRRPLDLLRFGGKDKKGNPIPPLFASVVAFADWRQMYATMSDKFDAVVVSTADHMHAPIAMEALNRGKHVYCQKPLAQGAYENRRLAEVAASKKSLVTQMGTQRIATNWRRWGAKLLRDGAIGPVKEIYAWTNRPAGWWPQGNPRPQGSDPIPEWLSWDLFLGVAPNRPFKDGYTPFDWRGTIDWGTGAFGDMGCHMLDVPFYELQLGRPLTAYCNPVKPSIDQFPESESVVVTYAATPKTAKSGLTLKWFDGGQFPDFKAIGLPVGWEGGKEGENVVKGDGGVILVGEKGVMWFPIDSAWAQIFVDGKAIELKPEDLKSTNHYHDWVDACITGKKELCSAPFEKAALMCESLSIGAMSALDPGKTLQYDQATCTFSNSPVASAMLKRTYREGWTVENL